jgi:hypothetical protein
MNDIKTVLDWTVSKTSLDLFQWIKLHDAWGTLIMNRNDMAVRMKYPYGQPIRSFDKIIFGCCTVFLLILVIILPILIFSTLNPIL